MAEDVREFSGIASDSRQIKPGYLFAALSGTKTDGARYISDAVQRGATAVLGGPETAALARSLGVRFIADVNPRRRLALMAADFFAAQPDIVAAVTGTNGKTSAASFLRQIWSSRGHVAASLGTLGIDAPSGHVALAHTTPEPVTLHNELARLKHEGVEHLALEASSHGLDQFRLDGLRIKAAGFTNITRDHLDYHVDFSQYLSAKLRLFDELLDPNGVAVVNADAAHSQDFTAVAERRGLRLVTVGTHGEHLRVREQSACADGQNLVVCHQGQEFSMRLPLAGRFQASNALVAAGLAIGLGDPADAVFAALGRLKGAPGRLELVAHARSGAPIYIDYAHTPDAMEAVLGALRPHAKGKLVIVFGCGGERDRGKRFLMGAAAREFADMAIVTDDNPRGEDAATIRREAMAGCPEAKEIGDRAEAIHEAIASLDGEDVLVIAGKGHEEGQVVGTVVHPFSDRSEAVRIAKALGGAVADGGCA